jgi:hypothetical protein
VDVFGGGVGWGGGKALDGGERRRAMTLGRERGGKIKRKRKKKVSGG